MKNALFIIIIGTLTLWGCSKQDKEVHYRGIRSADTKTVYLADARNVTTAKQSVLTLMTRLSNRFDAIIWITATPDSFSSADPYDPTITYRTVDTATHGVLAAVQVMRDSGWVNSATQRYLFHSFALDDSTEQLIRRQVKDTVFTNFTKVGYDYVPTKNM